MTHPHRFPLDNSTSKTAWIVRVFAALALAAAMFALAFYATPAVSQRDQIASYQPPTLSHSCTWDGSRTGRIEPTATPTTAPGDSYVLGPDGQPLMATNGKPVRFPAWIVARYGYGVGRGALGMHTTDYLAAGEALYPSWSIVNTMDAYCTQDIALLVAYSAANLSGGTPFNPSWRQGGWTASMWETNILSPIPRRAHLSKPDGFALVMEIDRQLGEIRAGKVAGWQRDGYGEWRRTRKPSALDFYRPGRMSTSFLGTDLVRFGAE